MLTIDAHLWPLCLVSFSVLLQEMYGNVFRL